MQKRLNVLLRFSEQIYQNTLLFIYLYRVLHKFQSNVAASDMQIKKTSLLCFEEIMICTLHKLLFFMSSLWIYVLIVTGSFTGVLIGGVGCEIKDDLGTTRFQIYNVPDIQPNYIELINSPRPL